MKITALNEVKKDKVDMEGADKAWKQMPLSSSDGAPNYSFRVFTLEPEGHTPYHQHGFEHMNYVIEGEGALVNEKGELKPLKAGDFALVLPHEKHQYRNTSADKDFVMICAVTKDYE